MPVLRPPGSPPPWPDPDADQARAIGHRGGALLVRGAAGTGKTVTALRIVADRVDGGLSTDDVLLLAPTRRAAARLRDELSGHLRRTTGSPVVRTASSAAFAVLRARAALLGEPPPTLISGPEQDLVLADLLAGHAAGDGAPVRWPASRSASTRSCSGPLISVGGGSPSSAARARRTANAADDAVRTTGDPVVRRRWPDSSSRNRAAARRVGARSSTSSVLRPLSTRSATSRRAVTVLPVPAAPRTS